MTAKSVVDLTTEANTNLADNVTQDISAQDVRDMIINTVDSYFNTNYSGINSATTTSGEGVIGVDTGAAVTVTLGTVDVVAGRIIVIKDVTGSAATNNITINTQAAQTIDGVSSIAINVDRGVVRVVSDGTNWHTV